MIHKASQDDIPVISLIAKLSMEDAYKDILRPEVQGSFLQDYYNKDRVGEFIEHNDVYIIDNDEGFNVGFLSVQRNLNECEIIALYILPKYQNQGLGSKLLQFAIAQHTHCTLFIDIESRNIPSQKFYAKHGFVLSESFPIELYGQPLKITRLHLKGH